MVTTNFWIKIHVELVKPIRELRIFVLAVLTITDRKAIKMPSIKKTTRYRNIPLQAEHSIAVDSGFFTRKHSHQHAVSRTAETGTSKEYTYFNLQWFWFIGLRCSKIIVVRRGAILMDPAFRYVLPIITQQCTSLQG